MSGIFGGGGSSSQTVQQKADPWGGIQPNLLDIAGKAKAAYDSFVSNGYNMPYSGQRSAGANPYDAQATSSALSTVPQISGNPAQTQNLGNFFNDKITSGGYTAPGNMAFDSGNNAAASDHVTAAIRPILQNFTENMIPRLNSTAINSGAYGGSKDQELRARSLRDTEQQVGDTAANISYQDFITKRALDQQDLAQRRQLMPLLNSQELQAGTQVPGFANTAESQALQPSQIYQNVADKERGFSQQNLNDQLQKWNELINSPFSGLSDYAGLTNGVGTTAGKGATQTTSGGSSGLPSWLSGLTNGISGIGQLGAGIGGAASLFNGGAAAATGLPWLASGGAAGMGSSLTALLALL